MLLMQRLQPCLCDVRVNLRGGKIGVAEEHLDHAQIGAVIEQMRGESVAQGVWRQRRLNAGGARVDLEVVPEGLARHGPAARGGEQRIGRTAPDQPRPTFSEITADP